MLLFLMATFPGDLVAEAVPWWPAMAPLGLIRVVWRYLRQ